MFIDFNSLDHDAKIDADLCIIGAGAAGITIARAFLRSKVKVCLLESGDEEPEDETQALYEGTNIGTPYFDLDTARVRVFGGTTYHWGGWCAPLTEMDFSERDWVPLGSWPISRAGLLPFYEQAQEICDLGAFFYDEKVWAHNDLTPPAFDSAKLLTRFWQFSPPTRFGEKYWDEIGKSKNVDAYLHCNVVNIQANSGATAITNIDIRSLDGKRGTVRAKIYVLACGGLENPRLLLASNSVEKAGLGNGRDQVGRYFMEHPHTSIGTISSQNWRDVLNTFGARQFGNPRFRPGICPSDHMQRRAKILNSSVTLDFVTSEKPGTAVARSVLADIKRARIPNNLSEKLLDILSDFEDVAKSLYERKMLGKTTADLAISGIAYARTEQLPNPDSRVTLTADRDQLGMNRIALNWKLSDIDKRTLKTFAMTFGSEFARLGLGRIKLDDWLLSEDNSWSPSLTGGFHHMGTTRMSSDPKNGVVDKNCKLHGIDNLFVGGSSVFATSGYANPTLTIVALSLRLAAHVKSKFS